MSQSVVSWARGALVAVLVFGVLEFMGCAAPPPPRSAKNDIKAADDAMESGKLMYQRKQYELAGGYYQTALEKIGAAEMYASGNERTLLRDMKTDAQSKKIECDSLALSHPSHSLSKPAPVEEAKPAAGLTDAARKEEDAKKKAEAQQKSLDAASVSLPSKSSKKEEGVEEPAEAVSKKMAKTEKPEGSEEVKQPPKDKNGIFPDLGSNPPPLQVVKLVQKGKFVVAYFRLFNNTDQGKRISLTTFFKNRDNQDVIEPRTTAVFPYERFSTKVADPIADQSIHNLTANSDESAAHQAFDLVSVGEANTEDAAKTVAKAYIVVRFDDGTTVDATGPDVTGKMTTIPGVKLK